MKATRMTTATATIGASRRRRPSYVSISEERTNPLIVRYAAYLAVAGVALAPAAARADRPATPAATTLRYHYVAGQDYAYKLQAKTQGRVAGAGTAGASQRTTSDTTGAIRYHIVSVDRTGGATADVTTSDLRIKVTVNGQARTTTAPTIKQRAYLGADGSQRATARVGSTSVGVQALSSLPAGPVTVGDSWTSQATVTLPGAFGASLPPLHVTTRYRLAGLGQQNGHTIATIVATNSATFPIKTTIGGTTVDMRVQESTTSRTLFDGTAGRVASTTAHQLLHLTIKQGGTASGSDATIGEDLTSDTSLQPA